MDDLSLVATMAATLMAGSIANPSPGAPITVEAAVEAAMQIRLAARNAIAEHYRSRHYA